MTLLRDWFGGVVCLRVLCAVGMLLVVLCYVCGLFGWHLEFGLLVADCGLL